MDKSKSNALKGIVVLMVIVSHLPKILVLPGVLNSVLSPLGYHGVAIFLLLSGYGCFISIKKKTITEFLKRRIINIIPELFVITVIAVLLGHTINGTQYNIFQVILNGIGVRSDILKLTWYILFQYMCYYGLCSMMYCSKLSQNIVAFAIAFAVLIFIICLVPVGIIRDNTTYWGINFASFSAGIILATYKNKMQLLPKISERWMASIPLIVWALGFVFVYYVLGNPEELVLRNLSKGLLACWFAISIFYLFKSISCKRIENILAIVGEYSYELYLIHGIFVFVIPSFFSFGNFMLIPFLGLTFVLAIVLKKTYVKCFSAYIL